MLQLPSNQSYVLSHAKELRIVIKPVEYPKEIAKDERGTLQGKTKAEYLGWTPERIICAYYFHDGPQFIGVIAPSSLPPLNQRDLFQKVLGMSRSQGKRYAVNGLCPEGMEPGTCSPFPSQSLVGKSIRDLLIYNSSELNQTPVDISIGGQGDLAQRTSVHIPYHGIHQILQKQFDNKVHLFS
jgi:hypothetical protein